MKKLITPFLAVYTAFMIVACGGNDNGGGAPIAPIGPQCGVGQIWNGYMCMNSAGIAPGQTVRYYDYNRYFYTATTNYPYGYTSGIRTQNGDMTIVNQAAFQEFLKKAMGVCDRNIWGYQSGFAKCSEWASGSFQIEFSVDSSLKPTVSFTAYPEIKWYQFFISIGIDGGGMAFNPLYLNQNNTFNLINQSKGFEIRAQGSYMNGGGLKLIQIQVLQGTLNDGYFTYDLYFPYNNVATKIATGKFKRR